MSCLCGPIMLLSVVNLKLQDRYKGRKLLCEGSVGKQGQSVLLKALHAAGY